MPKTSKHCHLVPDMEQTTSTETGPAETSQYGEGDRPDCDEDAEATSRGGSETKR